MVCHRHIDRQTERQTVCPGQLAFLPAPADPFLVGEANMRVFLFSLDVFLPGALRMDLAGAGGLGAGVDRFRDRRFLADLSLE